MWITNYMMGAFYYKHEVRYERYTALSVYTQVQKYPDLDAQPNFVYGYR